jgi:vacuolar-type H+-ATPase subunit E/Vma4
MEILQLVDQLEKVLNSGWRVPLTSSLMVNEEECLRLIDQMRISVPSAIKESERMIAERDRILSEAHAQADEILAQAREQAMDMIRQDRVTLEAQAEAQRIIELGRSEAMRMIQEAEDYALSVLQELTEKLSNVQSQAENGIQAILASRAEAEAEATLTAPSTEDD